MCVKNILSLCSGPSCLGRLLMSHIMESQSQFPARRRSTKAWNNCSRATQNTWSIWTAKSRPVGNLLPLLSVRTGYDVLLKERIRKQWQVIRYPALKAQVNCLQTRRNNRWRRWQSRRCVYRLSYTPPPLLSTRLLSLWDQKAHNARVAVFRLAAELPVGTKSDWDSQAIHEYAFVPTRNLT